MFKKELILNTKKLFWQKPSNEIILPYFSIKQNSTQMNQLLSTKSQYTFYRP